MPLVFQYGSNCTAARLNGPNRLDGQAEDLGSAQTVEDFDIAFDVYSRTNGCAASDLVPTPGRKAWGVLYEVPDDFIRGTRADGRKTLKQIEGTCYKEEPIRVIDKDGNEREAVTFLVPEAERRPSIATSAAYVSWIAYGLRDHGVPEEYIAHVAEVAVETNRLAGAFATEQIRLIGTL
jgi:cation transport regulator ChaC